jgi:hypothetical protein
MTRCDLIHTSQMDGHWTHSHNASSLVGFRAGAQYIHFSEGPH